MDLLDTVFGCSNNWLSFSADKVTTGTYNFVSFILNVAPAIAGLAGLSSCAGTAAVIFKSVKTQSLDQVNVEDTSQLINSISNVLQKLLRCFNGTIILASYITLLWSLSLFGVFSTRLLLYLNDAEFVIGSAL